MTPTLAPSAPPWDVVIVGAGPGGSTAARLLAQQGYRVALLDKARFPRPKTCGDGLTPRAVAALRQLGLEEEIAPLAQTVRAARLYASPRLDLNVDFSALPGELPPYGYVVPRLKLDAQLLDAATRAGARFFPQQHGETLVWAGKKAVGVRTRAGTLWRARWVILATGAATGLLRRSKLLPFEPHDIYAVRGYWQGVPLDPPALEFFFLPEIPHGYAWVFPAGEGIVNVGLGVYRRAGEPWQALRPWLERLVQHHPALAPRFAAARLREPLRAYPLRSDFPQAPLGGPGWLVLGEAAGLVNPVTGEGIDLALESALLAAQALAAADLAPTAYRAYRRQVQQRFGSLFRGLRLLRPLVMRPRVLRILLRQAQRHPALLHRIVGITLGVVSPYSAFAPSTWWWLLR